MNRFLLILLITLFSVIGTGHGQVSVTVQQNSLAGLEVFFLKDFDITRPGSGPPIFTLRFTNTSAAPQQITLQMQLTSGVNGLLATGITVPFIVPGVLASPLPPINSNQLFSNAGAYAFSTFNFQNIDNLIQSIQTTGRLPTDTYTFSFNINSVAGTAQGPSVNFYVRNPRRLDIAGPGGLAIGPVGDWPMVFTNLPQFRWESDLSIFRVTVAEARKGEDPESALNQEPRFRRVFYIQRLTGLQSLLTFPELGPPAIPLPATTFQYPASGEALTLRPGKAYYWQVEGFIQTSSGRVPLNSDIYGFRVADLANLDGRNQQVRLILRNLLGQDYERFFGENGELIDYNAKRLSFEGKDVTIADLLSRLPKLRRDLKGFRVE